MLITLYVCVAVLVVFLLFYMVIWFGYFIGKDMSDKNAGLLSHRELCTDCKAILGY